MARYANQTTVKIHRDFPAARNGRNFTTVYTDKAFNAISNLTKGGFAVWFYLLSNTDEFLLDFSPQNVSNSTGIALNTAKSGFKELQEKGYIKADENGHIHFYESPND